MTFRVPAWQTHIPHRCTCRRDGRHRPHDRGSATVELVVLAPVLVLLCITVVFLGRAGQSAQHVRHAADQAARAASRVSHGRMESVARTTALADLAANGGACAEPRVDSTVARTGDGAPSSVTVTVTCTVEPAGLELLGSRAYAVSASSTEVVDRLRAP